MGSTKGPASLWDSFADVPDPRDASGKRYALPAVLTLASVALLSGSRSLYAVAQFGRDRGEGLARAMGFDKGKTLCCSALHNLFGALDAAKFEAAIRAWLRGRERAGWTPRAVSIDGKELRGTQGRELPGVRLLAAFAHEAKVVLGQVRVEATTNEHKAALRLLDLIPLAGVVVTGDAMFCQRDLSKKVVKKGARTSGRWTTTSRP